MLSKTSQYALRAVVYLAENAANWPIAGTKIAADTRIPAKYLSKVLGDLVRAGVLEATRGYGGGFRMARTAQQTSLHEVLSPFEDLVDQRRICPFSSGRCSDHDPCQGHEAWKKIRTAFEGFLSQTSVQQVSMRRSRKVS